MKEYPHIDTIWKRDMANKGRIIEGDFACEEFAYLANSTWVGTEKVDGTNIRVMWDGNQVKLGGKTDNAQMYARLVTVLEEQFTAASMATQFPGEDLQVCLYGEGYGAGIQKGGGRYLPKDAVGFTLFDVKVGDWWLRRSSVEEIGEAMGIRVVPTVFTGTLLEACEVVKSELTSTWGDFAAEGLVLNPSVPLLKRNGQRVIAKIKTEDYRG